jgi:hypothetical protein
LKLVKVGDDKSPSHHVKVSYAWWRVLMRVPEKDVESLLLYCNILGWHYILFIGGTPYEGIPNALGELAKGEELTDDMDDLDQDPSPPAR